MTVLLPTVIGLMLAAAPAPARQEKPAAQAPKAGAAAPAAGQDALPTVESVRKLIDEGNSTEALKQLARLMSLRGKAAQGLDRYELWTLKGEAHLRLKASEAAASAFRKASAETDKKEQIALARATELLVRKSKNLAYTPRKPLKDKQADPISIVSPEGRKAALGALFVDEMADVLPKVEAAKDAKSVAPMAAAIAAAKEVEYLETAANGSADQITGIVEQIKEAGKTMLNKAVERGNKQADRITQRANELVRERKVVPSYNGPGWSTRTVTTRRGVQREDVDELKEMVDACAEVIDQAKALQQACGADREEFDGVIDAAQDLRDHLQRMLRVHNVQYDGKRGERDRER